MQPEADPKTIAFVGLGDVGSVAAACLASLGHRVIGVDSDPVKVHSIRQGLPPFHKPRPDQSDRQDASK